jgi:hypothetical protein
MFAEAAESLLSVAKIHSVLGVSRMEWIFQLQPGFMEKSLTCGIYPEPGILE